MRILWRFSHFTFSGTTVVNGNYDASALVDDDYDDGTSSATTSIKYCSDIKDPIYLNFSSFFA